MISWLPSAIGPLAVYSLCHAAESFREHTLIYLKLASVALSFFLSAAPSHGLLVMGIKRKAGPRPAGRSETEKEEDSREHRTMLNVRTYGDVADSEDEFHLNQDKILLEDSPASKRQRRAEERGWVECLRTRPSAKQSTATRYDHSDEEVLAIPGDESVDEPSDDESGTDTEHSSELTYEDRQPRLREGQEVLERSHAPTRHTQEEEFDLQGWGSSKKDYYNADAIETEGDAVEEEQEALRLQKKFLEGMRDEDFGLDDLDDLDQTPYEDEVGAGGIVHEALPQAEVTESMPIEERSLFLRTRHPEVQPLANDFLSLYPQLEQLRLDSEVARGSKQSSPDKMLQITTIKWTALQAYLASLVLYFTILTSGAGTSKAIRNIKPLEQLRKHAVMETLVRCRKSWKDVEHVEEHDAENQTPELTTNGYVRHPDLGMDQNGAGRELADDTLTKRKRRRKSKAQRAAQVAIAEANARQRDRLAKVQAEFENLPVTGDIVTEPPVVKTRSNIHQDGDDSDFGEEVALAEREAAEKAKRKKTLRFYTAQIAQKANRRELARRSTGGDMDLPNKERLRDRQLRLNTEAEKRGKRDLGAPDTKLGQELNAEDAAVADQARQTADEDYYEQVATQTRQRAKDKAALALAQREAAAVPGAVVRPVAGVGPDGKRAITYAIEKNRGVALRAGKRSVRNPRVKKRKTFEDKMKKLGSIRPLYKGGEERGGYGGELTGIKSNLVKSVKL